MCSSDLQGSYARSPSPDAYPHASPILGEAAPPAVHPLVLSTQRVRTLNVGPVGLRDSLPHIMDLFADNPAVVFVQEAKLPPCAVRALKKEAHRLLPHYSLYVGTLPAPDSAEARRPRIQVVTFVHAHLAARASLLEVTRQLNSPSAASRRELLAHTHFLRTTDIHSNVNILWVNVYAFQADAGPKQAAQWDLIGAVLDRWQG